MQLQDTDEKGHDASTCEEEDCPPQLDEEVKAKINMLYGEALARYPTYEVMVCKGFSKEMRKAFGETEDSESVASVFQYARVVFGYLSESELEQLDENNAAGGICHHGLPKDCCPVGCGDL